MKLKHVSTILLSAVAVLVTATGCVKNKEAEATSKIEKAVSAIKLPEKLNATTTMVGCYYQDKTLTFRNEVEAGTLERINADSLKSSTLDRLRNGLFPRELTSALIESKSSVRYIYVCNSDSIMFSFTPDELK